MNENIKVLCVYEHVLGAKIALHHLLDKKFIAHMDELPQEGDAKIYIQADQHDDAIRELEEWKKEIINRWKTL